MLYQCLHPVIRSKFPCRGTRMRYRCTVEQLLHLPRILCEFSHTLNGSILSVWVFLKLHARFNRMQQVQREHSLNFVG